jgi:hypothetical protein
MRWPMVSHAGCASRAKPHAIYVTFGRTAFYSEELQLNIVNQRQLKLE